MSEPLRHQNGYYVIRVESAGVLPYDKVKDEIYKELKDVGSTSGKKKRRPSPAFSSKMKHLQSIKQQAQQKTNGQ